MRDRHLIDFFVTRSTGSTLEGMDAAYFLVHNMGGRALALLLPSWTASRTRPVAIDNVIVALVRELALALPASAWHDISPKIDNAEQ